MKKVDVIRPSSLNSIIGPSGTLKRILKNEEYFKKRGYDFEIFTYDNMKRERNDNFDCKIQSKKNKFLIRIKSVLRMIARHNKLLAILYIKRNFGKISDLVNYYLSLGRDPDIVVFHSILECYYYLTRRKTDRSKVVLFNHTDGIPMNMLLSYYPVLKNTSYFKKLLKIDEYVVKCVSKCVFISKICQNNFLDYYPEINPKKTIVILNGIEDLKGDEKSMSAKTYDIEKYKYRLCCVGTINFRKGHKIILEALKETNKEVLNDIHLLFIGEGPERIYLEEFVVNNNLSNNVQFLGSINNKEIHKYLKLENIYILMSKNEGLPISIIEGMRSGLAIISTRIAGIPELVKDGENGILLDPNSDQLINILNNINLYDWKKMGERSRDIFLNDFTFERMRKEYCDMLDEL